MIVSLELRAAARCRACSVLTPLPGLRNQLSCRNCAASIDFAATVAAGREGGLRYPFGGYYDALAEAAILIGDGHKCHDARDSQGSPVELRRAAPECRACGAALPLPTAGAPALACPRCGDSVAVRWPDDETRAWDPRLACVIGDGKGRGVAARDARGQGATVGCGSCGAPIAGADQGERRRSRTCTHCGAANYLTDAAWLALFPQPDWHRCYLVYWIDERALLALHDWLEREKKKYWLESPQEAARRAAHAEARAAVRAAVVAGVVRGDASAAELEALAADAALDDAEAAAVDARLDDAARLRLGARAARSLAPRWAASPSAEVRCVAAAHPGCGAAVLDALAGDGDARVRAAVATRPETPVATLARLRKDRDASVVAALRTNPAYKPGFFQKLFG